ncbi:MAG: glycerophosphodiester phosphodiesterase [Thiobacillus sp.]|nr:glycerophosphodiester phosphodiesterase [Thiobacillus sp.]
MSRYIADTEHVPCAGAARSTPASIAHRGAADDAPENTLAAFKLAWQQGADGIEGDFHLTRDGEIVCIHDADTRRTAGQATKVAEATLAELRRLDVGSWKGEPWRGARIPTLGEVLATVPAGKQVFIEIKCGPEILPALKAAFAGSGLQSGQAIVMSFDAKVIAEAKRLLPQLKALWLTDFKADPETGVRPTATAILQTLEKTGADGVGCRAHPVVDQVFMQTLRTAQKEVHLWTVDDVPTAKRYLQLGADSLTSNRAGWLKQQLCSEPGAPRLPNQETQPPNRASGHSR